MKYRNLRELAFTLHRYIGLAVALILIIVGLTGSVLVFQKEIDHFLIDQKFGRIVPQEERLSVESLVSKVNAAYRDRPDWQIYSIISLGDPKEPYTVSMVSKDDKWLQVYVNPYTGKILGSAEWETSFIGLMFKLHYTLLAGDTGKFIVGIAASMLLSLSITGLVLWPGWRKFINGFKIKFKAHPQRVNFDIHKVVGIISAVFFAILAFTGFCWNFPNLTYPIIHAVTFTPKEIEVFSKPIPGKSPLGLNQLLEKANAALPGGKTTVVNLPKSAKEVFKIKKKFPHEGNAYGDSFVYLDQYSGKVLRIDNSLTLPLGHKFINSFIPLHYGTYGGLATRILYVFVGLAPTILAITALVMWRYRKRSPSFRQQSKKQNQIGQTQPAPQFFWVNEWPWF